MQFNLWLSLVAALLLATGGWGWFHGGADANAYRNAIKETVPGSVLSTTKIHIGSGSDKGYHCEIGVSLAGAVKVTRVSEASGACDADTKFQRETPVEVELWKGKVSTLTVGGQPYPTEDNPANNNALASLQLLGGIALGLLRLASYLLQRAGAAVRRRTIPTR